MDVESTIYERSGKSLLKEVKVRPALPQEMSAWANIMSRHHYLGYKCLFRSFRHPIPVFLAYSFH